MLANFVGELGNLGIIPIVGFFGLGYLTKEDFNAFPLNVVTLSMCGLALGYCILSSGLLEFIVSRLSNIAFWASSERMILQFVANCTFTGAISCFVSHTATAIIFLPTIHRLIHILCNGNESICRFFVLGSGFACSLGMMMLFSSFPNVSAFGQETHFGVSFLQVGEFIKICFLCFIINLTVAICWCYLIG